MKKRVTPIIFSLIVCLIGALCLNGCKTDCTYPELGIVKVRIFNAMPDQEKITVRINGKIFVKDFLYEQPSNFMHDGVLTGFGYYSTYEDGSPLVPGNKLAVIVSSDTAGKNILMTDTINLNFHLQTLFVMGRGTKISPTDADRRKVLRIEDDNQPAVPGLMEIRLIDAVQDLPPLDVYWNQPDGNPNATIEYGVDNPYFGIDVASADSLKVTEKGNPKNVVLIFPYKLSLLKGLVVTSLIRGESHPFGKDRAVSAFVLSDNPAGNGNIIVAFENMGVRLVNATRMAKLSLLIQGKFDVVPRGNYPNQSLVTAIPHSFATDYLALSPAYDATATYWFFNVDRSDTLDKFTAPVAFNKDEYYSLIAIEKTKLNDGSTSPSGTHLILRDSTSSRGGMGRVRVVNTSPDRTAIAFTLGGRTVSMKQLDVEFFDVTPGPQSLILKDGAITKTINFVVPAGKPISLFLLPAITGDDFPFVTTRD
ncbi:MAG: hypothetical protein WCH46_05345 [bacterium]